MFVSKLESELFQHTISAMDLSGHITKRGNVIDRKFTQILPSFCAFLVFLKLHKAIVEAIAIGSYLLSFVIIFHQLFIKYVFKFYSRVIVNFVDVCVQLVSDLKLKLRIIQFIIPNFLGIEFYLLRCTEIHPVLPICSDLGIIISNEVYIQSCSCNKLVAGWSLVAFRICRLVLFGVFM